MLKINIWHYWVCWKSKKLRNCLCSSFFSTIYRNNGEFGSKKKFTDHWTANTIQLFVAIKRSFFWSILFLNKSQQRGIHQRLLAKSCISNVYLHTIKIVIKQWTKFCLNCHNTGIRIGLPIGLQEIPTQMFSCCKIFKKIYLEECIFFRKLTLGSDCLEISFWTVAFKTILTQ